MSLQSASCRSQAHLEKVLWISCTNTRRTTAEYSKTLDSGSREPVSISVSALLVGLVHSRARNTAAQVAVRTPVAGSSISRRYSGSVARTLEGHQTLLPSRAIDQRKMNSEETLHRKVRFSGIFNTTFLFFQSRMESIWYGLYQAHTRCTAVAECRLSCRPWTPRRRSARRTTCARSRRPYAPRPKSLQH